MKCKIVKLDPSARVPEYAHDGDAGADLFYCGEATLVLAQGQRYLLPTGIGIEMEPGYEMQIRPKSGRALQQGLTVLNSPSTVDNGYRGEIRVMLINTDIRPAIVRPGEKIAQAVFQPIHRAEFEIVDQLGENERGSAGFGSTGLT